MHASFGFNNSKIICYWFKIYMVINVTIFYQSPFAWYLLTLFFPFWFALFVLVNCIVKFTFYCLDHLKKVLNSSDLKLFSKIQSLINSHVGSFRNYKMGKTRSRYYLFKIRNFQEENFIFITYLSINNYNNVLR